MASRTDSTAPIPRVTSVARRHGRRGAGSSTSSRSEPVADSGVLGGSGGGVLMQTPTAEAGRGFHRPGLKEHNTSEPLGFLWLAPQAGAGYSGCSMAKPTKKII